MISTIDKNLYKVGYKLAEEVRARWDDPNFVILSKKGYLSTWFYSSNPIRALNKMMEYAKSWGCDTKESDWYVDEDPIEPITYSAIIL